MLIGKEIKTRTNWIYWSMVLMLLTLFLSRAALSVSIIFFCLITILSKDFKHQLLLFLKSPLLLSISLLFFIPLISVLWSDDYQQWLAIIQLKLPFLFLPIAFAGNWKLTKLQWKNIFTVFIIVVLVGSTWSTLNYIFNPEHYNESYLKAKLILTPLENDHVRFSWIVVVAVMLCFLFYEREGTRIKRVLLIVLSLFLIFYLHLLAARLGLLCLYLFLFVFTIRKMVYSRNKWWLFLMGSIILLPLIAWFSFPTLQNRIKYSLYDINEVRSGNYYPGSNDGTRILSMKAGWYIMNNKPIGAGAGDLKAEVNKWFSNNAPAVPIKDRFYPSNEWLIYGAYAGWVGLFLFTLIMVIPFLIIPANYKFYWFAFNATAIISFIVDMGLEVQYGIFLYSFLVLCLYNCFKSAING